MVSRGRSPSGMAIETPVTISESVPPPQLAAVERPARRPCPTTSCRTVQRLISGTATGSTEAATTGQLCAVVECAATSGRRPRSECYAGSGGSSRRRASSPRSASNGARPFVTGLRPTGRLLAAASSQLSSTESPLVAWTASPAAAAYDVEWSRRSTVVVAAGRLRTLATSALLPLKPGTWWYRVRGINDSLPGNREMRLDRPEQLQIAMPTFSVVGG